VITRGEALGHGQWIDTEFLRDIVSAAKDLGNRGIKSRFTHPGLSGDALGKVLGRTSNLRLSDGVVRGDLHLLDVASKSPDGDLAQYVLDLADEAPDMFGASIVYTVDRVRTKAFTAEHTDEDGEFQSPDSDNTKNLPHVRLGALLAADVVDDPAANPDGFFSATDEVPERADAALAYLLGQTDVEPNELVLGGIHPQRARAYVAGWCERNGVCITTASAMDDRRTEAMSANEVAGVEATEEVAVVAADPVVDDEAQVETVGDALERDTTAEALQAERDRATAISADAARLGLAEYGAELIADGVELQAAQIKLRDRKLAEIARETPVSPGPDDPVDVSPASLTGDELYEADWDRNAEGCRDEFVEKSSYMAYRRGVAKLSK